MMKQKLLHIFTFKKKHGIHYVNLFLVGLTLFCYLSPFLGLIAQFFLGVFQLLIAFLMLSQLNRNSPFVKKQLFNYFKLVISYFVIFFSYFYSFDLVSKMPTYVSISIGIVLPMSIAFYQVYITSILES